MATATKQVNATKEKPKEVAKEVAKEESNTSEEYLNELVDLFVPVTNKEQPDVFIGVNGKNWLIKPGKHVMIPRYAKLVYEESERNRLVAIERQRELESK